MPRYASQNLAAVDPEFRKAHGIGQSQRRYAYGKENNVFVAQGADLFANGFTIRLLPMYDETAKDADGNRQFVPFREGHGGVAFGDWCRVFTCANWVGNPGMCFIIHDGNEAIDIWSSPYHVLRKAAWDSKDLPGIGRLYTELLSKNFVPKSYVGSLRKPEPTLFVSASGVTLGQDGRPALLAFNGEDKAARIIGLKTSAAQAFNAALSVRDESTGDYAVGDLLSFGPAKLITFLPDTWTAGPHARNVPALSPHGQTGAQAPAYATQGLQGPLVVGSCAKPSAMTHRAVIHDTYNGHALSLEPYAERIVTETKSWDEYMWFPTYEEQAEIIARAFPLEALRHAWTQYPQYLQTLPKGTTTVEVGDHTVAGMPDAAPAPYRAPSATPFSPPTRQPAAAPAPAGVPWEGGDGLDPEAEAGLAGMFAASQAPAPAPVPQAPPAARPAQGGRVDDIIARARAAAAQKR